MDYEQKYKEILAWARKNKARLNGVPIEDVLPELAESEDDRVRKVIYKLMLGMREEIFTSQDDIVTKEKVLAYLEKQKEQKPVPISCGHENGTPAEDKSFYEWVEDYWSHNKVNNPYSYNKGDEIQFDHKGFVSFCEAYCYPQNLVLHDTFGYEEGRQTGQNEGVKFVLNNPEKYGLQKPAEWSEEDEEMIGCIIDDIREAKRNSDKEYFKELCDKEIAWLKSLRPQYNGDVTMTEAYKMGKEAGEASHWKPSEDHLSALLAALTDLYEQLKKL